MDKRARHTRLKVEIIYNVLIPPNMTQEEVDAELRNLNNDFFPTLDKYAEDIVEMDLVWFPTPNPMEDPE